MDLRIAAFGAVAMLGTGILAALVPTFWWARKDTYASLKASTDDRENRRIQSGLSVVQVAISTVLLLGGGLMLRTLDSLNAVDAGFDREMLVRLALDPSLANYDGPAAAALQRRLMEETAKLPGIEAAAVTATPVMQGLGAVMVVAPPGRPATGGSWNTNVNRVTASYFDTLGIALLSGTAFEDRLTSAEERRCWRRWCRCCTRSRSIRLAPFARIDRACAAANADGPADRRLPPGPPRRFGATRFRGSIRLGPICGQLRLRSEELTSRHLWRARPAQAGRFPVLALPRFVPSRAMDHVIRLTDLRLRYGRVQALDGLSLTAARGDIYGFLGRNGAGKTTTLRVLMGIVKPDGGTIELFGRPMKRVPVEMKRSIGYVSQEPTFYPWMTARRLGRFVASFYPTWDEREFARLLEVLDVPPDRRSAELSGGTRSKLALALALAPRPPLLLLDEPTTGLDPVARREFNDLVAAMAAERETTVFFSSHLVDEVESIATRVGIIQAGRMRAEGRIDELQERVRRVRGSDSAEMPAGFVRVRADVWQADAAAWDTASWPEGTAAETLSLEEIFLAFARTDAPATAAA